MFVVAVLHEYGASVACLQNPTNSKSIHFVGLATSFFHPLRYEFWGRPAPPSPFAKPNKSIRSLGIPWNLAILRKLPMLPKRSNRPSFQIPNAPNLPATSETVRTFATQKPGSGTNQPTNPEVPHSMLSGKKKPSKKLRSKKTIPQSRPHFLVGVKMSKNISPVWSHNLPREITKLQCQHHNLWLSWRLHQIFQENVHDQTPTGCEDHPSHRPIRKSPPADFCWERWHGLFTTTALQKGKKTQEIHQD